MILNKFVNILRIARWTLPLNKYLLNILVWLRKVTWPGQSSTYLRKTGMKKWWNNTFKNSDLLFSTISFSFVSRNNARKRKILNILIYVPFKWLLFRWWEKSTDDVKCILRNSLLTPSSAGLGRTGSWWASAGSSPSAQILVMSQWNQKLSSNQLCCL